MIPEELKQLKQWVCAGKNKVPVNVKNSRSASPTDSRTWHTYEEALEFSRANPNFPNLGFVLTENDPYTIIDLDLPENDEQKERHTKIVNSFDSYTEVSQSGNGVHIIIKGSIPKGFKKDNVEAYASARYMIMTGMVCGRIKLIEERQSLLNKLVLQMGAKSSFKKFEIAINATDIFEVEELHHKMLTSPFITEEYDLLCQGDWEGRLNYQSQSDADFNLAIMLCENSEDNAVCKKLFTFTKLYRTSKPKPYLDYTFSRAREKSSVPQSKIDFSQFKRKNKEVKDLPVKKFLSHKG